MELHLPEVRFGESLPPTFFIVWGVVGLALFGYMFLTELGTLGAGMPERMLESLLLGIPAVALVCAGYWLDSTDLAPAEIQRIGWYSVGGVIIAVSTGTAILFFLPTTGVELTLVFFYFVSTGTEGALLGMLVGTVVLSDLLPVGGASPAVETDPLSGRTESLAAENDRLDEFASVVAHDLRNPLNVAQARCSLAREECNSEHLAETARAHTRMENLIEDCLILARQGQSAVDCGPVALADQVDRAWRNVETEDARLVNDATGVVYADDGMLGRLFENLVDNAVEHGSTSPPSQALEDAVEQGSTSPDSQARQDAVEHGSTSSQPSADDASTDPESPSVTVTVETIPGGFAVEDDGPGIPAADRDQVFRAGYSGADGTGFGLRIVEATADAHGWDVTVTEGSEGGARFEIRGVESAGG